jgi:hypothetical protein
MAIKKDIQEKTLKQIVDMFGCYGAYYVYKRDNYTNLYQHTNRDIKDFNNQKRYADITNNKIRLEDVILIELLNRNQHTQEYKNAIDKAKMKYEIELEDKRRSKKLTNNSNGNKQ